MATLLARLADAASRRRRIVIGAWLALLLAGGWFSLHQSDRLSGGGWEVPGSASVRVSNALDAFPKFSSPALSVLVTGRSSAAVRSRLAAVRTATARDPNLRPDRPHLFAGGRAALLPVTYVGPTGAAIDVATRARHALVQTTPETRTRLIGQPAIWSNFQEVAKHQLARGEATGFPLILIILLAGFGTLVAALAPLAVGFAAVFLTGAVVYWLSHATEMSIYVTNMASMIGIGVAVDYSLFVVSRYRRELRAGAAPDEALRRALASSGTAVVFSGATVAVSLAGLFVIDVNAVRSMAIGAIVVVSIAVLATVTLLPALLGPGVERFRIGLPWRTGESGDPVFWRRWTESVMAHPVRALALVVPFLLLLSAPLLAIKTYNRGLEQLPRGSEVRQATEQAQRFAGPGFSGPVHMLVDRRAEADRVAARLERVRGVARVTQPLTRRDGRRFLVDAYLTSDPESAAAQATLRRIERAAPEATVGGATQFGVDVDRAIFGGLPRMLLFILAVSYVVLLVLLRSVLLPLKAILMNLLSVGAAYGALVAVFQWGWLDWIGYSSPGYVDTIVPALVLAVTFGLSMDYEVFLLTRIRERYALHGRNDQAVAEGLVGSARIITSAALVMVAVFAAFAVAGAPSLRELGVGLAVAVGLDASLVRLVVVPATMRLLGDWNWWVPRRLAKLLPAPAPLG
ncbi:MAG: MMPL family transporter [Actinobacteria bacterium]|nr:MAG: MMPL family transporter [Actinomycetota bacterium]